MRPYAPRPSCRSASGRSRRVRRRCRARRSPSVPWPSAGRAACRRHRAGPAEIARRPSLAGRRRPRHRGARRATTPCRPRPSTTGRDRAYVGRSQRRRRRRGRRDRASTRPTVRVQPWARADHRAPGGRARRAHPARRAVPVATSSEPGVGVRLLGAHHVRLGPRPAYELHRQSGVADPRRRAARPTTARAGDLVQYPGHVMMYLGVDDAIVHASNPESDVELTLRDRSSTAATRPADPVVVDRRAAASERRVG